MAYSPLEDRYLSALTAVQFPDLPVEPETPAEAPVMLAAGPSQTRSDAQPSIGPIPRNKAQEALGFVGELLTKAGVALDQVGLDVPVLGRITLKDLTVGDAGKVLEDMSYGFMPVRGGNSATGGIGTFGLKPEALELMNVAPAVGVATKAAVKGAGKVIKAAENMPVGLSVSEVGKSLAPKAGEMVESYLTKTGAILKFGPEGKSIKVPVSPKLNTPAFKNWFGDSKVVDAEGQPLIVYHGTNKSQNGEAFTSFDTYASNYGLMGQGSYFTDNPNVASSYTAKGRGDSPTVYPMLLSIKNPIDMDAKADAEAWMRQFPDAQDFHNGGDTNESWYRAAEEALQYEEIPMYEGAEIMQDGLRAMGFDGITHIGGGRVSKDGVSHRVFIAFDPTQIKSVFNKGTFDPNDPRILYGGGAASVATASGNDDKGVK